MASQNLSSPDGPNAAGGPSVRRVVSLGGAAVDPGPMLAPAARPAPDAPESGASPERLAAPAGRTAEPPTPTAASATHERSATDGPPATDERSAARGGAAAEPDAAEPDAAAVRAAPAGPDAPDAGAGADEPPSGKPRKPLLAAAGLTGVVLLAVPLLVWATGDTRDKEDDVAAAAGADTLLEGEPSQAPEGRYTAAPAPQPSTAKPSAEPSPDAGKPGPRPAASTPAAERTEPKKAEKKEPEKKTTGRQQEKKVRVLAPTTAATAVQRLASAAPGRHICYRVHVKDAGWTGALCDGETAGRAGEGRPVTAINIAVTGTGGMNANEFVQKDGWTTGWSGVANGVDLTLGSAGSDAPNLSGFAIGVGEGHVCQNNKLGDHGWGGVGCDTGQDWVFGGSTESDLWLEAMRLTV